MNIPTLLRVIVICVIWEGFGWMVFKRNGLFGGFELHGLNISILGCVYGVWDIGEDWCWVSWSFACVILTELSIFLLLELDEKLRLEFSSK